MEARAEPFGLSAQQSEFSSALMHALLPPPQSKQRQGQILFAVFWSQLLLTAPPITQCQSTVPHFHIPISFVSQVQTGTGALLWQILEGGHRCIALTTAITAKGTQQLLPSANVRHLGVPVIRGGH